VQHEHRRADVVEVKERRLRQVALRELEWAPAHSRLTGLDVARIPVAPTRPVAEQLRRRRARYGRCENISARDQVRRRVRAETVAPEAELAVAEPHLADRVHRRHDALLE